MSHRIACLRPASFVRLVTATAAGFLIASCKPGTDAAPKSAANNPAAKTSDSNPSTAKPGSTPAPGSSKSGGASSGRRAAEAERDRARQAAAEAVPVETAAVARGPIAAFLSFNSTLETESVVDIFPQTAGQVETLLVEEGRIVKEGDPLLKIDDRELRVDVEEADANYRHLEKNFERMKDLYNRSLINKQDYETQEYQAEQARIRLDRAKIRLSYATVRAPFDGVISSRETQVGSRVGANTKLFSMVKLDDIVARVFVPGRYLPVVAENQPAVVTSEFMPNREFKGWVKRISPVIDPKSGTFRVTVGVRAEKLTDLPPGLFVGVRVITDTRPNAVLVPKRAVVYEGGERYVYAVINERAVKRKLSVGYEDPQNIEAVSGFDPGTDVVVLGQNGLKDGSFVRIVNAASLGTPEPEPAEAPGPAPKGPATASTTEPAKGGDE